ncbi:hypothetical protein BY458DRAFT_485359 [Sporodiniella umbellata]|nr:hypothetical protein BY458DRAFT_485359 [Sporodiniella umbellata]
MLSFHQRSHSTPVGHAFINTTVERDQSPYDNRLIDLKDSSPLSVTDGFFDPSRQPLVLYEEDEESKTSKRCMVLLDCRMDRGFFYTSECHWTCYRRNYFQVTASFSLPGLVHQDRLILQAPNEAVRVKALYLRLRACTLDSPIKPVALTQMTPKRDKGPQREPPMVPVQPENNAVTFERLQFKMATANNGKKRATQQYFRLVLELVAQTENALYTVSECYSQPLIVRGRSPGHYNADPLEPRRKRKYSEQDYNAQVLSHARSHSVNDSLQKRIKPYQDNAGVTSAMDHWRYQRQRAHEGYYVDSGFPSPFSPVHHPYQWPDIQFKHEE